MKNKATLEEKQKRHKLSEVVPLPAPYHLYIDPSGACNFKCSFCPCNNSEKNLASRHQIMKWETFEKVLSGLDDWADRDRISQKTGDDSDNISCKVVDLHGFGEPLLNPRIVDFVRELHDHRVCREIRTVTNAYLLTPELGHALIDAGMGLIRISLEALDAQGYKDVCGMDVDFDRMIENITEYYRYSRGTQSKVSVKIISAALKNEEDAERFYEMIKPISDFSFIEDVVDAWPGFDEMKYPKHGKFYEANNAWTAKRKAKICTFPFTELMIHADGHASPCCYDWAEEINLGNINTMTLDEIWTGDAIKEFMLMHLDCSAYEKTFCKDCNPIFYDDIDDAAEMLAKKIREEM